MSENPFAGTWIYRSFYNDPDISTDFDKLEVGRATIVINDGLMASLSGTIGGPGWNLNLTGSRQYGMPMRARFEGRGVVGGEEWIYDYDGYLVAPWPNGVQERPAMTGSLIRTIPHSGSGPGTVHPAGVVFSFYAVKTD